MKIIDLSEDQIDRMAEVTNSVSKCDMCSPFDDGSCEFCSEKDIIEAEKIGDFDKAKEKATNVGVEAIKIDNSRINKFIEKYFFDVDNISDDQRSTLARAMLHEDICSRLTDIYVRKNLDYGDSFADSVKKHGLIAAVVRMEDKLNRLVKLSKNKYEHLVGESISDTLLDLANYCIMLEIYLTEKREEDY